MWRRFFYYTRAEQRAIYLLGGLLLVLIIVFFCLPRRQSVATLTARDSLLLDSFLAGIDYRPPVHEVYGTPKASATSVPFLFDPNRADSATLQRLGLPPFMIRNILKYRNKGGRFRSPEAFARVYGLREEDFRRLLPYISIDTLALRNERTTTLAHRTDSTRVFKYPEGTQIDLNNADTTELKRIPGIGSGIARQIVAYRQRLGGFVSVAQLREMTHLDTLLHRWFVANPCELRRLRVNKDGLDKLRAHPYMNFYKARAIVEYRKKRGRLQSLAQLAVLDEFNEEELRRIAPYLSFE